MGKSSAPGESPKVIAASFGFSEKAVYEAIEDGRVRSRPHKTGRWRRILPDEP